MLQISRFVADPCTSSDFDLLCVDSFNGRSISQRRVLMVIVLETLDVVDYVVFTGAYRVSLSLMHYTGSLYGIVCCFNPVIGKRN